MKDQPKPATAIGYFGPAFDAELKPKPASGEWTAESVLMMLQSSQMNTPYSDVANAHNAALAAERQKVQTLTNTLNKNQIDNALWIRAEDNPGFHRHE